MALRGKSSTKITRLGSLNFARGPYIAVRSRPAYLLHVHCARREDCMLRLVIAASCLVLTALLLVQSVTAGDPATYWRTEVGSVLVLDESSTREVTIRYVQVPEQYAQFGITPGTIMFQGRRRGDQLSGTAIAFMANSCRIPYPMQIVVQ